MVRTVDSSRIVLTASHSPSLRCEMVGRFSAGSTASTASQIVLVHVQHQPDLAQRVDGAFEQHADVFQLAALPGVLPGRRVGDQLRVRFEHRSMMRSLLARSDEPVSVTSTMASASTGGFTSVAPQLNSTLAVTPLRCEIALGGGDQFGGDDLAFQILARD